MSKPLSPNAQLKRLFSQLRYHQQMNCVTANALRSGRDKCKRLGRIIAEIKAEQKLRKHARS